MVQGHCVIRNGDTNFVTRLVATEFEAIYAVAHPGRARVHGFGVFGGSNGYWRTSLLHRTRMRGAMLTEDIDSSMRVVQSGEVIISDPDLVSTELAPETWGALWNQRLRWAQGWSQVSLRHLFKMVKSAPTLRQRMGVLYLLGWREVYPWISLQIFPLLAYWWYRNNPPIDWFVPIFVCTSLLTFSVGPLQTWSSYRLAHPSIKQHRSWFVLQGFSALFFYTELKNVMARTAHLKEAMRERKWKVTPRTGSVALDAEADRGSDQPAEPALLAQSEAAVEPAIGRTADPATNLPADISAAMTQAPDERADPTPSRPNRPRAGRTDPTAGRTDPRAGRTDPTAGRTDPTAGRPTSGVPEHGRADPPAPQSACPRPPNANRPSADGRPAVGSVRPAVRWVRRVWGGFGRLWGGFGRLGVGSAGSSGASVIAAVVRLEVSARRLVAGSAVRPIAGSTAASDSPRSAGSACWSEPHPPRPRQATDPVRGVTFHFRSRIASLRWAVRAITFLSSV